MGTQSMQWCEQTFVCKRSRGNVGVFKPADREDLMVGDEQYKMVHSFCYLGDTLNANGGVDLAVTARVRCGWWKFREMAPFLTSKRPSLKMKGRVYAACVRSCMLYGSETWALRLDHVTKLERAEMRMIRWMCGVTLKDRMTSADLRTLVGVEVLGDVLRRGRLRWYGHVMRMSDDNWVKRSTTLEVAGKRPVGRPKKTWAELVAADCRLLKLNPGTVNNREAWRKATIRSSPTRL